jgi:hypothetical protein
LGAGSGIDTQSLASSLVDAERAPRQAAIDKNIKKNEAINKGGEAATAGAQAAGEHQRLCSHYWLSY